MAMLDATPQLNAPGPVYQVSENNIIYPKAPQPAQVIATPVLILGYMDVSSGPKLKVRRNGAWAEVQ